MSNDLAKLNRLRVNAGKTELKSWKASQAKLDDAIKSLEDAGHTDALPGANVDAAPVIEDPEIAKARPEPEEEQADETPPADKPEPKTTKGKTGLARGLDTDGYAKHSRTAVRQLREKEKKEEREAKKAAKPSGKVTLSDEEKRGIKQEAEDRKRIAGAVDPKKDPEKAARQKKHVEDKQKARADKPKAEKDPNQFTVADVARELDIDPKVARAKLRRYEDKPGYPKTVKGERWTFPKSAKAEIVKILK